MLCPSCGRLPQSNNNHCEFCGTELTKEILKYKESQKQKQSTVKSDASIKQDESEKKDPQKLWILGLPTGAEIKKYFRAIKENPRQFMILIIVFVTLFIKIVGGMYLVFFFIRG